MNPKTGCEDMILEVKKEKLNGGNIIDLKQKRKKKK